jgi:zinc transport system ATP-binding protein
MSDAGPLIQVSDLAAGYSQPVVGPVSFSLGRGEILGISGPNGCGKSTLLRALVGSARLFGGSIERRARLRISHQQQGFDVARDIPLSGAELLTLTDAPAAGLPDWLRSRLGQRLDSLSGGQMQFLRLWACLMAPTDVVLLDEPTNNLDREGVAFLQAVLHRLDPALAVIIVSHDAPFVRAVCTSVIELAA